MGTKQIADQFSEALEVLQKFNNSENHLRIETAAQLMVTSIQSNGKIISCGNGGSMCDAMHFAEELTGRYRNDRKAIPALSISDPSHISCVGNDYGYEFVFSRYIEAIGQQGDVLLAISTSGNSKNIVKAFKKANELGVVTIGLTGKGGGAMKEHSKYIIEIDSNDTPRIQESHILVGHIICEIVENNLF